ncbi:MULTISPECIES: cytochrome c-type biogenesis protein [unclassified Pseudomonas]|uniref:cytochrome c-type biogenesis protein n=1 Tax=unclassified Pseudomonas TaxID=196821 RepID=UPI000BCA913A|nr:MULTISPECIES: cytochrome c-type biogenesis protein [unclassified Pseudomonas]PVZ13638.1 cytochrome c-type biogenesis protein CcmH [Pseudomonas sp. URIL14HWK12:I12]PVZ23944.1 cytochrome c-type biogenesis protein CcmH [Pseudomonas sp. URIL14HWK12:I10]PVZ33417.1 cytochrome c-type biogenesis protein CcmH [Pseudomonas sp. URIL14HWK12:I11]SNZ11488.1 cytochrome c-type biogenesis protein CcmH [Pseudomonas sp. URIL14HWK12:I9]
MRLRDGALAAVLLLNLPWAQAAIDATPFQSETQRERFADLTRQLRCPKCQNQDLADSDAPIAGDLRKQIQRLMSEGKSDQQIVAYLVARYGEFIRYRPVLEARTGLLWFGPLIALLIGAGGIALIVRRRRMAAGPVPLSADEQRRLARLLDEHSR